MYRLCVLNSIGRITKRLNVPIGRERKRERDRTESKEKKRERYNGSKQKIPEKMWQKTRLSRHITKSTRKRRAYLPDARLGRCAGHEIRVYHFVWLDTFGCFKIIQMYAAMVAHLRLTGATPPIRSHVFLFVCRNSWSPDAPDVVNSSLRDPRASVARMRYAR